MDGLTHGLFPFLAGKFFRRSKTECAALLLGGIAPDFDIFIMWIPLFFQTSIPFTHRGITHTLIFGFATAAILLFAASRRYFQNILGHAFKTDIKLSMHLNLLLFAYTGTLSHLFLDWLTTFGIPLFYPFDMNRYAAELFFFIDFYLMVLSAMLAGFAIYKRARIKLPAESRNKKLEGMYVKMFFILIAAIVLLGGLRYYEKNASADYFGVPTGDVFPTFSITDWSVVDRAQGKMYDFNSFKKEIISEQNFTGTLPNRYPRQFNN